jgi:hypothetical protein
MDNSPSSFLAFDDKTCFARGPLAHVARRTQALMATKPHAQVLVFNAVTSALIEFDPRGTPEAMLGRLAITHPADMTGGSEPAEQKVAPAGPGRPRLGVVAREVTLLPRHWEWLGRQPGGASVALRKLVEQARHDNQAQDRLRQTQEATYRFMSAMAGDLPGFEDAARALFAGKGALFRALLAAWPEDVRGHLLQLAGPALMPENAGEPQHA